MEKLRICPKCNKRYKDYPAISREDNKTEICPICGLRESVEAFDENRKKKNAKARSI